MPEHVWVHIFQGRSGSDGGRGAIGETGAKVQQNLCHVLFTNRLIHHLKIKTHPSSFSGGQRLWWLTRSPWQQRTQSKRSAWICVCVSRSQVILKTTNFCMCLFSQGDRGKPGPVGPSGEPGEKVRGHRDVLTCFVFMCWMYSCLWFLQGAEGPSGPRGQPGDAVSMAYNSKHTYMYI